MDPNLVSAVLSNTGSQDRDRHPMHLEREMVVYRPTLPSWEPAMAPCRRLGSLLIATGTRLQGSVLPSGSAPLGDAILGEEAGH